MDLKNVRPHFQINVKLYTCDKIISLFSNIAIVDFNIDNLTLISKIIKFVLGIYNLHSIAFFLKSI